MIEYHVEGGLARITLDRPDKLNALNLDAWRLIPELFRRADADETVKVAIVSGRGRCFCAGADITGFAGVETEADRLRLLASINAAFESVERFSKPVIASVHGLAMGGGCELTMVSDIVIADTTAQFGLPEIRAGFMPGPALVRGSSHVSLHVLKYMVYTGEPLDAQAAFAAGLVNTVVAPEELEEKVTRVATAIAGKSAIALSEAKRYLNAQHPSDYDHVTSSLSLVFGTKAARDGIERFIKRKTD